MQSRNWGRVISTVKQNLDAVWQDWELSWNAGWTHLRLGKYQKALAFLSNATLLVPKQERASKAVCYFGLGVAYQSCHQFFDAAQMLQLSLDEKDGTRARLSLAICYIELGEWKLAEDTHLEGLRLKPNNLERLRLYGDFLDDRGDFDEAEKIYEVARLLSETSD